MIILKTNQATGHLWECKDDLKRVNKNGVEYYLFVCKNCGMKGRNWGDNRVEIPSGKYDQEEVFWCKKAHYPKMVQITESFNAVGPKFDCIQPATRSRPGSVHLVVDPPSGGSLNGDGGVWINGVGEAIRLLSGEYKAYVSGTDFSPVGGMRRQKKRKVKINNNSEPKMMRRKKKASPGPVLMRRRK